MSPWLQMMITGTTELTQRIVTCLSVCSGCPMRRYAVARLPSSTRTAKGSRHLQVVQPYNRLRMELAAAKKLESRASQELEAARPGHDIPPSLKAAAEACPDP